LPCGEALYYLNLVLVAKIYILLVCIQISF
jgi:hypothetical protein